MNSLLKIEFIANRIPTCHRLSCQRFVHYFRFYYSLFLNVYTFIYISWWTCTGHKSYRQMYLHSSIESWNIRCLMWNVSENVNRKLWSTYTYFECYFIRFLVYKRKLISRFIHCIGTLNFIVFKQKCLLLNLIGSSFYFFLIDL